jgi:UDP-N-acetylmuramoyl-tripeptide--D-alanyl-D-alanine ligase
MRAAFRTLAELAGPARRVAVLGDMFELGRDAAALHRAVGEAAAASGVTWLLALGPHAAETAAGARAAGAAAEACADLEALLGVLDAGLRPGDWLLIKGSRGMRMERVVQHLERRMGGTRSPSGGKEG